MPLRAVALARLAATACLLVSVTQGALADTYHLPLLPSAADPLRQGILRIVNHSAAAGEVRISAIDDSAGYFGAVTVTMGPLTAIQLSSEDLERSMETLGIIPSIGGGEGDWRLLLESDLDIEPLAYVQTSTGFIDSLHDVVPRRSFYHRVDLAVPSGLHGKGGTLRLTNLGYTVAEVAVFGRDNSGDPTFRGPVVVELPAGTSRSISALALENGAVGLDGRLGPAEGNWRLRVFSDGQISIMTLLDSPSGPLSNLSTADSGGGEMMLFPATLEPLRVGLLRITSGKEAGEVAISAVDDAGTRVGPVTLRMDAERTTTLDSHDLETGNVAKGLPRGLGRGTGDWRLRFETDLDLDIFGYARTPDGFLTAIHDVAITSDRRHHVPFFVSASDTQPTGQLRLSNPAKDPAEIRIQAWDDAGQAAPNGIVRLSLPPGATRTLSAVALEQGAEDLDGSLGKGTGNWRLLVDADLDIHVMSLMASPEGHLTNLSTTPILPLSLNASCVGGPMDQDDDGITDYCDADPLTALRPLSACADGTYVRSPELYPGLVNDCRVLIGFANYQAQSDTLPKEHVLREWGFGIGVARHINAWKGIIVSFSGRGGVTAIYLRGTDDQPGGLKGSIPSNFGSLASLTVLDLAFNQLSGPIPPELGQLSRLTELLLFENDLTGAIPPELGQLDQLARLSVYNTRLTGPMPWAIWERFRGGQLALYFNSNEIVGLSPPPQSNRPIFSANPSDNGNAAHHSVSYYQGPLIWEWNWKDEAVEHQRPVLGRWAALAVKINHETRTPPVVATRVLDGTNTVLVERLSEAAPPMTHSVGVARWRTEYVFHLPGELYQAGFQVVHVIDPDDDLAETNEDDNVGPPILLHGERTPQFRITFIPLYRVGGEPPWFDPKALMAYTRAYLPIRDDFQAEVGAPLESDAADIFDLLDQLRALWNAQAAPDEFYHGVFDPPWSDSDTAGGVADSPGWVGVSNLLGKGVTVHEIGHNFGLLHPPGCGAGGLDRKYPYRNGALGLGFGWEVNWRRFVSRFDKGAGDIMSYCTVLGFISDYHYEKAVSHWVQRTSDQDARLSQTLKQAFNAFLSGAGSSGPFGASLDTVAAEQDADGGLALSGRVRSTGEWSLTHAQRTDREPRPPAPNGEFTLIMFDDDGEELYREPLSVIPYSEGGEAGWAARTPVPQRPAREMVIEDATGNEVLRQELPVLDL